MPGKPDAVRLIGGLVPVAAALGVAADVHQRGQAGTGPGVGGMGPVAESSRDRAAGSRPRSTLRLKMVPSAADSSSGICDSVVAT